MITIEYSDLFITEKCDIEDTLLRNWYDRETSKYLSNASHIDGECGWLIEEFEGKHVLNF